MQAICEKVLIISGGKLIAFDEPEHLEKSLAGSNEILFTTEATRKEVEEVKSLLGEITEVSYRETQDGLLSVTMKQILMISVESAVSFLWNLQREKKRFTS